MQQLSGAASSSPEATSHFSLRDFVADFAAAMTRADSKRPVWSNARSRSDFLPGIGPHAENATVRLVLAEMGAREPWRTRGVLWQVGYPNNPRAKADFAFAHGGALAAVFEAKLFRLLGDNGKPNDNMLMHILSPYPVHRSAVTDVAKLANSGFPCPRYTLVFGYEAEGYPVEVALRSFERLAAEHAVLGPQEFAWTQPLVHPVHRLGFIAAWRVMYAVSPPPPSLGQAPAQDAGPTV